MDALATQLTTLQQQLAESTGATRQQLAELGRSQTAVLAAQSAQGLVLARLIAAAERGTALAAGEGSQQVHQREAQRARLQDQESPLDKDVVLDNVFSYVGTGDYLYTGAVSRRWRGRYIKLCYSSTTLQKQKLCTTYRSAVMTAARLQLALRSKLQMADLQKFPYNLARNIARRSLEPRSVLSLAKHYDLKWSDSFTLMAARTNKLELMQWLHECGCPINYRDAIGSAIHFDFVDILEWIHSTEAVTWDRTMLQLNLEEAGRAGSVNAAAWLRRQGARWPDSFVEVDISPDRYFGNACWMLSTVKWALANGCTWGHWQCQELAHERVTGTVPEPFGSACMELGSKQCAQTVYELFAWAHENGCPCTCEDPVAAAAALAEPAAKVAALVAAMRARRSAS
jgi:hypothetical protein